MKISIFKSLSLKKVIVAAAICMGTLFSQQAVAEDHNYGNIVRTPVFTPGEYDSQFYRIPALAVMNDGNLIAVADKRIESQGDLPGKIDVVARISKDMGKTWSDYITVVEHNEGGGYGDPAIVVDRNTGDILVICSHGSGIWSGTPAEITVVRSTDNGKTWGEPLNINPMILGEAPDCPEPIKDVMGAFASSGGALQLENGRLMFALVVRHHNLDPFYIYAIYSDDGGKTWKASENPGSLNGDETKVAQLADGTVVMSVRSRGKFGKRSFSYSKDNGQTWGEAFQVDEIPDPACNGDFIRYHYGDKDLIIQSLPAAIKLNPDFEKGKDQDRADIGLYISEDQGKTWPLFKQIEWGPGSYSALAQLPDGSLGVLTEETYQGDNENHNGKIQIWYMRYPIEDILGK